jgi:hypothetical protein
MELFVSYARPDRPQVNTLVERLRQAGIGVWLDSDLVGGQPWWDKILGQLRSCDAVLAAVSRATLNSQACRFEREYAARLGKPVLPMTLESMPAGLFPQDIARIQVIDYSQPSDAAAFKLAGAIFALPRPAPLPSPLPASPPVPQTRFGDLNDRISAPSLSLEEQLGIIGVLEGALGPTSDQEDRQTAAEMLSELAKRPDLYQQAARKIEALQAQAGGRARSRQRTPPPPPPPTGAVKIRRGMAITSAILTVPIFILAPIGIAAVVYSNKAKTSLAVGDTGAALKASSRVLIAFWITIALWMIFIIVAEASNSGSSTSGVSMLSNVVR